MSTRYLKIPSGLLPCYSKKSYQNASEYASFSRTNYEFDAVYRTRKSFISLSAWLPAALYSQLISHQSWPTGELRQNKNHVFRLLLSSLNTSSVKWGSYKIFISNKYCKWFKESYRIPLILNMLGSKIIRSQFNNSISVLSYTISLSIRCF